MVTPIVLIPLSVTVDIPLAPMNKQEAADYLGVSTRAIKRYTQKGKLSVKYEGSKTRPVAVYDSSELDKLKEFQSHCFFG